MKKILICCVWVFALTGAALSAKYEPPHGVYLGVFLPGENSADITNFNACAGREHAVYTSFVTTDLPFPWSWVNAVTAACPNAALHIAYEPLNGFAETFTDWSSGGSLYDRVYSFATNCALFDGPVFLRFGHEANGTWYPWCPGFSDSDAVTTQTYVQGWRNVADLFHTVASNVVMVWAPTQGTGQLPLPDYAAVYPGDDWVDWVGLSVYNGGYYGNNDRVLDYQLKKAIESGYYQDDADPENDTLQNFYRTFSDPDNTEGHQKPMMIAETASLFVPMYAYSNQQGIAAFESLNGTTADETIVWAFENTNGSWGTWVDLQYSMSSDPHSGTGALRIGANNNFTSGTYIGGTGFGIGSNDCSSASNLCIYVKREDSSADSPLLKIGIRSNYGANEQTAVWDRVISGTDYIRYELPRSELTGAHTNLDWSFITGLTFEMLPTNSSRVPADVIVDDFSRVNPAGGQTDQIWWSSGCPWGLNKWGLSTDAYQGSYALCFGGSRTNGNDYIGGNGCSFQGAQNWSGYDGITFYAKRGTNSLIKPWVKISFDSDNTDSTTNEAELTFSIQNTDYSLYTVTFPMFDTGSQFQITNVVRMKLELMTQSDNEDIADVYLDDLKLTQCSVTNYNEALENQHNWMQQLFTLCSLSDSDPADPDSQPDYIDISSAYKNLHMFTWFHKKQIEDGRYVDFEILGDGTGDVLFETYNQYITNSYFLSAVFVDRDEDGMDDAWEESCFGGTSVQPNGDQDHDGMSNRAEFLARTDPTDSNSVFRLQHDCAAPDSPTASELTWTSRPGLFYRLESTETLDDPFSVVTNHIKSTPPMNTFSNILTGSEQQIYFRIIQE